MKNLVSTLLNTLLLTSVLYAGLQTVAHAEEKQIDKVAAIVNGGVVLESEVQDLLSNIKKQAKKK